MKFLRVLFIYLLFTCHFLSGQSISFKTYTNPVIPGDHPDPTLTRIGNHFYTSGSSFNPTPKIYHSTDLVHWEVIAQPVSASWIGYEDEPGGGIWGGHMVFYNDVFWHYFGRGGSMYFVTAEQPEGPWSAPAQVQVPAGMSGLGVDNSLFIDQDTGKWYLLTKAGHENNHIVELGNDGQPTGVVLDLTWLNPDSEGNPYGWAEGPVMWQDNGYYYYSFAEHLVGRQYVMRSDTLTDEESAWTVIDPNDNIFTASPGTYNRPNHISPVVMLDDSTSWTIAHSYHSNSSWYAQGRQGLLCQVTYNERDFPVIQYPPSNAVPAPDLPSSGISWMVPKSDMFESPTLNPHWSFLGYISSATYSLEIREGWLYLEPYGGSNTVIQNDGEHNYSLITRVDFEPQSENDEAGLWIINGPETHSVKVFSTVNSAGHPSIAFNFGDTKYEVENQIGNIIWLKLIRNEHKMSGYYSADGKYWNQIGEEINALNLDIEQTQFNDFTGNQQGLYVKGNYAFFDLYIYCDAYTNIAAQSPANYLGVSPGSNVLYGINSNDWAMFAGVQFGNDDYQKFPDSLEIAASCAATGGIVEVWIDSIDTGKKIAECPITNTGGWSTFKMFLAPVDSVTGSHDVYLRFSGTGTDQLFQINWLRFLSQYDSPSSIENYSNQQSVIKNFQLFQNYPNPFNPTTTITFTLPIQSYVTLEVFDSSGQKVAQLFSEKMPPGAYSRPWNAQGRASGIYFIRLQAGSYTETKKLVLLK
jgi:xylan 1,4-beta-xylosidase